MNNDEHFLKIAEDISLNSIAKRKKVGCIIVQNGIIISSGYNTPGSKINSCEDENNKTYWHTLHSEANAIFNLFGKIIDKNNLTMYITLSPCKECAKLILQSGIKKVIYNRKHSCQEGIEFLKEQGIICEYISELINL